VVFFLRSRLEETGSPFNCGLKGYKRYQHL
jgi:hypothetical protein